MRCRKARRLMLLYREGELSSDSRRRLVRHTTICAECAAEAGRILLESDALDALRKARPFLGDPEALTMQIMRGTETPSVSPRPAEVTEFSVERVLALLRPILAGTGACLGILFITLSVNDARSLASLETRLRRAGYAELSPAERWATDAAAVLDDRTPRPFAEAGAGSYEAARVLESLLHPDRMPARITMEEYLLRRYPALASVTLQDGIDEKERAILAGEGERFLRDLESLIRKEKSNHER